MMDPLEEHVTKNMQPLPTQIVKSDQSVST